MERPLLPDPALAPSDLLTRLGEPVRQLVLQVQALYAGSWDDCAEDLRRRGAGHPYLFRLDLGGLASADEALSWLSHLSAYEAARGERLPAILSTAQPA
jgi:hypothetical protein